MTNLLSTRSSHILKNLIASVLAIAIFITANVANALPSFARQTGLECTACHVGGFGPQLTPMGRQFKLGGYTQKSGNEKNIPLSAMLVAVYDQTAKDLPADDVAPHFSSNNNAAIQEASVFLAGGFNEHIGGLVQATYSGIDKKTAIDNMDIRYARPITLFNENAIVGVSLNNNPTNQDLWNTAPAWSFPYMSADLAPSPTGAPILADGLGQQVLGLTSYISLDNTWYGEVGFYRAQPKSILRRTHAIESIEDFNKVDGYAPYGRFVYSTEFDRQNFSVGLVAMRAKIDFAALHIIKIEYNDVGIDSTYQFTPNSRHNFSVNASLIHETNNSFFYDEEIAKDKSNTLKLTGSYYYENTYGLTLSYFNSNHTQPFVTDAGDTFYEDAKGIILQADYTPFGKEESWQAPFANVRLGIQGTFYNKFNGASRNYNFEGRNASDNNTIMFMIWSSI